MIRSAVFLVCMLAAFFLQPSLGLETQNDKDASVKAIRRLVDAFEMKNYKLTMTLVHTQGNSKSIVSGTMFHRDENVSFQLHNIYPPQKYGLSARHIINGNAYYAISGTCSRWNRDYETQLYKAIEINTMYAILNRKDITVNSNLYYGSDKISMVKFNLADITLYFSEQEKENQFPLKLVSRQVNNQDLLQIFDFNMDFSDDFEDNVFDVPENCLNAELVDDEGQISQHSLLGTLNFALTNSF